MRRGRPLLGRRDAWHNRGLNHMFRFSRFFLLLLALMTSACTYRGGDIGNPLTRKTEWFSFVEGEDLRSTCQAGTPDRYRVVYNALYLQQVRIYELDSVRRNLRVRVTKPGNLVNLNINDPLSPWRAAQGDTQLDAGKYDSLVASFSGSGMFNPPDVGLDLPSNSYFWTAAYCRDGKYGLSAWKYPSEAFSQLAFPGALFALDPTSVPVRQAEEVPFDPLYEDRARRNEVTQFLLTLGKSGLVH